jgi:hypothetical protein
MNPGVLWSISPQLLKGVHRLYISRLNSSEPDHEQSSHDQRLLRYRFSLPIPQGHPVQNRRAHRGCCSHSRRGSKNLVWLRTTSSNDFTQNPSTSRSHRPSDRRNASSAVGDRRNIRRGINNALRSPRNVRVSRHGWIGRLDLYGEVWCPETTAGLDRGTRDSVRRRVWFSLYYSGTTHATRSPVDR